MFENKKYGECPECGALLQPIWFTEEEFDSRGFKTGRVRNAVDVLRCPICLADFCVDDTFDGPWRRKD